MTVDFDQVRSPAENTAEIAATAAGDLDLAGDFGPLLSLIESTHAGQDDDHELPAQPWLVVFAGDHGIAENGVSAFPVSETARRAIDLSQGVGSLAAAAAASGVGVLVVDVSIKSGAADLLPATPWPRIRRGSGSIDTQDAISEAELDQALQLGKDVADRQIDGGADLLIGALCGVGISTPTAALICGVTGMEPVDATSRGSGIGDAAWIRKVAAVRDARYRIRLAGSDTLTMLRVAGGADLAALTGFIAQAAVRRTPVMIDDVSSAVCAALARRLAPGADDYLVVAAGGQERGHRRVLEILGRAPLTTWTLALGAGTAAVLQVPIMRALARSVAAHVDGERTADSVAEWDPELL